MSQIDYLCIGHVTRDLTPDGPLVGGTVAYAALTAKALGLRPAVVSSASPDFDLSRVLKDIPVLLLQAKHTTTFENRSTPRGLQQILHSVAEPLGPGLIPPEWRSPAIAHLGPVANEVDPGVLYLIKSEIIGLTPQGWHRRRDRNGQVRFASWERAREVLPLATAVVVSEKDLCGEVNRDIYRRQCRLLVVTRGAAGCVVYHQGEERRFPALNIPEIDPTGAGDIFAAAFFIRFRETDGDPWEAARFATLAAGPGVRRRGLKGVPTPGEVERMRGL